MIDVTRSTFFLLPRSLNLFHISTAMRYGFNDNQSCKGRYHKEAVRIVNGARIPNSRFGHRPETTSRRQLRTLVNEFSSLAVPFRNPQNRL
jgi:hypothetical protein